MVRFHPLILSLFVHARLGLDVRLDCFLLTTAAGIADGESAREGWGESERIHTHYNDCYYIETTVATSWHVTKFAC